MGQFGEIDWWPGLGLMCFESLQRGDFEPGFEVERAFTFICVAFGNDNPTR